MELNVEIDFEKDYDAATYDAFFKWLDEKIPPMVIPTLFPELKGFTTSGSDGLINFDPQIDFGKRRNICYTDVLMGLWYNRVHLQSQCEV